MKLRKTAMFATAMISAACCCNAVEIQNYSPDADAEPKAEPKTEPAKEKNTPANNGGTVNGSGVGMTPSERVAAVSKGKLKNPYTGNKEMIEEGKGLYFSKSCNGCHGGTGGGGMCPPLSNETFVYGSDDDTMFRLIVSGTDELAKAGYFRKGMEGIVGPMPPFAALFETDADVWKVIAWIRTVFNGDPKRINW